MKRLYIGHPTRAYDGDLGSMVEACARTPEEHDGWELRSCPYDFNASLNVRDFASMVLQAPGPILLLRPIQNKTIELIRLRLSGRVPIEAVDVSELAALRGAITAIGHRFEGGEPFLAQDVVVALLLMRKLDREHMWGGNAKGYLWTDDIPKGRGLDEKYAGRVPHVLNVLLQQGLLIKKRSQTSTKYALNAEKKVEIYGSLRDRRLPEDADRILMRHGVEETVRALDVLDEYEDYQAEE